MTSIPETGFLRLSQILGNPKANPPTPPRNDHVFAADSQVHMLVSMIVMWVLKIGKINSFFLQRKGPSGDLPSQFRN